jgi:hypothetical protein
MVNLSGESHPRIRIRPPALIRRAMAKAKMLPPRQKHISVVRPKSSSIRPKATHMSYARPKRLSGCIAQMGRACMHGCQCDISGDCLGIDGYTADELTRLYYSADNPELMGGKIKESLQRAKKKVQKVVKKMPKPLKALAKVAAAPLLAPALLNKKVRQKVQKDVKKGWKAAPKPLKALAKIAAAPLALVAAPALAPALLSKKVRKKVGKETKKQWKALPKGVQTALKIAAAPVLIPGAIAAAPILAPKIAAAAAIKKVAANRKRRVNIAEVRRKQVEKKTGETLPEPKVSQPQVENVTSQSYPGNVNEQQNERSPEQQNEQQPEQQNEQQPEKKKVSGGLMATGIGLAALLPFLL